MKDYIKQFNNELGEIYKIALFGTLNYKLPGCKKVQALILNVSGYGYYSSPSPKSKNNDYRYYLDLEIENTKFDNKKCFVAILMNPSATLPNSDSSKVFDSTIKNIIRIAYKLKYNKIIILNSYPIIDGDSTTQNKNNFIEKIANINTAFITKYILDNKEKSTFLIAWGGDDSKVKNIQKYMKTFYDNKIEIYAYRKTETGKPCHASILVENCYKYVSEFLDNENELVPLYIQYSKNKKYIFSKGLKKQ